MRVLLDDLTTAFGFLTRLPLPAARSGKPNLARAVWAFPLAGILAGSIGGAVFFTAHSLMLGGWLAAGLAIAAQVIVTGALHEDGLADVADGFGGGATRGRRLEIMHDSRIGAYGVLALVLVTGLRWGAIAGMGTVAALFALIAAGALSRLAIVIVLVLLPAARNDGLGISAAGPPALSAAAAAVLTCAAILLLLPPGAASIALALAAGAALLTAGLAWLRIGGFTGDVLGAAQQVAETAALMGLLIAGRG